MKPHLTTLLTIPLLLTTAPSKAAIYTGGPASGYTSKSTGSTTLNGQTNPPHKYTGGPGDGYSYKTLNFTPPASIQNWTTYQPQNNPTPSPIPP